jgi:transcriptional regulator with XRE-family HTH domain
MSNGGKRLRELLMEKRWDIAAIAVAIGVGRSTIYTWKDTAPIDKLYAIAKFTDIPFRDIAECFNPDRELIDIDQAQIDRIGGDQN